MKRLVSTCGLMLAVTASLLAQTPPAQQQTGQPAQGGRGQGRGGPQQPPRDPPPEFFSKNEPKGLVEFEMMTWPEVYRAIHKEGKTTALLPFRRDGEPRPAERERRPHAHGPRDRQGDRDQARQRDHAAGHPVFVEQRQRSDDRNAWSDERDSGAAREQICEQAIATGFNNVVIFNDHGGGTNVYGQVAKKLEEKYRAPELAVRNIHVLYADKVYAKAQNDFDTWLKEHNLPVSGHAGIPDTSTMMYLQQQDGKPNAYTRLDLLPVAVTVPAPTDPNAPRPVASGVSGDGRPSDVEIRRDGDGHQDRLRREADSGVPEERRREIGRRSSAHSFERDDAIGLAGGRSGQCERQSRFRNREVYGLLRPNTVALATRAPMDGSVNVVIDPSSTCTNTVSPRCVVAPHVCGGTGPPRVP